MAENRLAKWQAELSYEDWICQVEAEQFVKPTPKDGPLISVIVPVYNVKEKYLRACLDSVLEQTYEKWELCVADDCSTLGEVHKVLESYASHSKVKICYRTENGGISACSNSALSLAQGEYVALLDCDDMLSPYALAEVARAILAHPQWDLLYSDEDHLDGVGLHRVSPHFKPDWSPDTFMSWMYICHLSIYRKSLVKKLGGFRSEFDGSQDYDLALRAMEETQEIGHIPYILYHWRERPESVASGSHEVKDYAVDSSVRAKEEALRRRGLMGKVVPMPALGQSAVWYESSGHPLVSMIILEEERSLLKGQEDISNEIMSKKWRCGLQEGLVYPVLEWVHSPAEASGEYLCFLRRGVTPQLDGANVPGEDWLERLLGFAQLPGVGVVGPKLVQEKNPTIIACGYVHKETNISPVLAGEDDGICQNYGRNVFTVNVSALPSVCFITKRERWEEGANYLQKAACENSVYRLTDQDMIRICNALQKNGYRHVLVNQVVGLCDEIVGGTIKSMETDSQAGQEDYYYPSLLSFAPADQSYYYEAAWSEGLKPFHRRLSMGLGRKDAVCTIEYIGGEHLLRIDGWAWSEKEAHRDRQLSPRQLVLCGERESFSLPAGRFRREDLQAAFPERRGILYGGFRVTIPREYMPQGRYRIALLIQKLLLETETTVEI